MSININIEFLSSDENDEDFLLKNKEKFSKIDSEAEEGEIFSDYNDDDNDESNLEKLFKNKDDRRRLLTMSEKKREEEIFKRSLKMNDIKSRQNAVKMLNEQKKKKDNNDCTRKKKRSLEDVFGHCNDNDSRTSSSSVGSNSVPSKRSKIFLPQTVNLRQRALENQKSSTIVILSQLQESRKQRREKLETIQKDKAETMKKTVLGLDSNDDEEKKIKNIDGLSTISNSSSEQMQNLQDEFEDKFVEEMEDLSKIRLSRLKLENWVHMPFFKDLIKGCFVRINIGEGPEVIPIYRIAEIIDVVETVKIYDLGKTRTNVGISLRIGKSVTMFHLPFVSNQSFLQSEFDRWRNDIVTYGFPLPKMSFIEEKCNRLKEYSNFSINNEETMKQVLMSKKRFQKGPVNIALRKAELTRLKMAAENDGDVSKANQFQDEIDELNMKADELERKRTEGIKNISYINQRNREITMEHVEKAIELEMAEKLEWDKKGGDPFVREPTKPVLNYKKKKQEKLDKAAEELRIKNEAEMTGLQEVIPSDNKTYVNNTPKREPIQSKININNIHNFELNLDIIIDSAHNSNTLVLPVVLNKDISGMITQSVLPVINSYGSTTTLVPTVTPSTGVNAGSQGLTSKRILNLQDYKKRKGLI